MVRLRRTIPIAILGGWIVLFMVYDNLYNMLRGTEEIPKFVKRDLIISNSTNITEASDNTSTYYIPCTNTSTYASAYVSTSTKASIIDDDYLIKTEGCTIPNYSKNLIFKEPKNEHKTCGERAVTIEKYAENRIKFKIDDEKMRKYNMELSLFTCCYSFASRSNVTGKEDVELKYSPCTPFQTGTEVELLEEVIIVGCKKNNKKKTHIYSDAYMVLKKPDMNKDLNVNLKRSHWNVLIIGMDTMSRARALSTLPKTINYFKENHWLDFKAYQKVGSNTFPNLMALLTGKNVSEVYHDCASGMDKCNRNIIWNHFRKASYKTAYGEDYLSLPDTFARYKGFSVPPTDHYTRPFFLTGEQIAGNLVCASKIPSAYHLLDYAYQFSSAYKDENFFGLFWMNSYSHNTANMPSLIDNEIIRTMERLKASGILKNTFVIFNSDHGIRFGDFRQTVESFYAERLPMLFMWVPTDFKKLYSNTAELDSLIKNQVRLVTPYDVHLTLRHILKLSGKIKDLVKAEGCPKCTNLFQEMKQNRTCADASVDQKWCSCHNLIEISSANPSANRSIEIAVANIRKKAVSAEAIDCFVCQDLKLKKVLRIHFYTDSFNDSLTYYVIAVVMSPGEVAFEATVKEENGEFSVVEPTDTISPYNARGSCVKNKNIRAFCVCKKIKCRKPG